MTKSMKAIIHDILFYIQSNIHNSELRIEDIAAHFGYDKFYFSREFKRLTGYSLNEYISSVKSEKVIELLKGDLRIIDIQQETGYASAGTFSTTFKKYTGSSPKQYRNEMNSIYTIVKEFETRTEGEAAYTTTDSGSFCSITIETPECFTKGLLFIGLFRTPIPNHKPVSGIATKKLQHNVLKDIPPGDYYLLACAINAADGLFSYFNLKDSLRGRVEETLCFPACSGNEYVVTLRPPLPEDPPILINLAKLLVSVLRKTTM